MNALRICCLAILAAACMGRAGDRLAAAPVQGAMEASCVQKVVVVTVWPGADTPGALVESYHLELGELLTDLGVCFRFVDIEEATRQTFSGRIVLLRMLDHLGVVREREAVRELPRAALAWTHASGRDVTPFGAVDLGALRGFLGIAASGDCQPAEARQQGVAVARVAAHEIYHMLTRSRTHSAKGLMKAALTRDELLSNRAPGWTGENRVTARTVLHPSGVQALAAVSGAQSKAADKR